MAQVDGHPAMQFDGAALVLISIGDVLQAGDSAVGTKQERACVVVLRNGSSSIGVLVDAFVGVNDFVIRTLDVGGSEGVWSGVISTADGSPCLVLNPDAFAIPKGSGRGQDAVFKREPDKKPKAKVVLVVDDSITTRTLEKSILEAHGYRVRLSVDGRDAIAQLRSDPTDIVVSDIEMPHVNGFELVRSMKSDRSLADIPIVLVTSRDDPEDRRRGLELGADAYVVKQRFDQAELLRTIGQII
jgi:two-component system chemotaxis sensor kinase CheA